ncbi:MAG: hypothetical protein WAU53_18310 [Rhodoplanes sp.]
MEQDALAKEHRAVHSGVNDGQPLDETSVAKHRPLEIRADNSELVENQAPIDGKITFRPKIANFDSFFEHRSVENKGVRQIESDKVEPFAEQGPENSNSVRADRRREVFNDLIEGVGWNASCVEWCLSVSLLRPVPRWGSRGTIAGETDIERRVRGLLRQMTCSCAVRRALHVIRKQDGFFVLP